MSIHYNSKIVTDGLVLCLDAANPKSSTGKRSVISCNTWIVGTGSVNGYTLNGDGNSRVIDTNPFGVNDVVWQSLNNDITSDADGGWDTSTFSIDNTKLYRFSTWVRRKVLGDGRFYLGTRGYNDVNSNVGVLLRSSGAVTTNPYFINFAWNLNLSDWYLVVGHIWPVGSGTGSAHPDSGIYTTSGVKVGNPVDFVWQETNAKSVHRSYLYYSTDSTTNQQWYQPRVDVCDGSHPTITEILNNVGNICYDNSGNNNHLTLYGGSTYNTSGYFTFANNQTSQYIMNYPFANPTDAVTYSCWFRSNFNQPVQTPFTYSVNGNNEMLFYIPNSTTLQPHPLGINTITISTTDMTNKWVNFTWTRLSSSGVNLFYRDGEQAGSYTGNVGTNITTNGYLIIGQESDSAGGGFDAAQNLDGDFSVMHIYNRVLSAGEISQNFNALRGRYGV